MAVSLSRTDRDTKEKHANPPAKPQTAKKSNSVKVYPNPANDLVTLEYQLASTTDIASVVVINQLGQKMSELNMKGNTSSQYIDIDAYSTGVYFYEIMRGKSMLKRGEISIIKY